MTILRIDAGPGCGKSHALATLYFYIRAKNRDRFKLQATEEQLRIYDWCDANLPPECREKCGYFAYNADIVEAMKPRVHPTCECRTAHGWGYKVINSEFGYVPINKSRSNYLVAKITGKSLYDMENKEKFKWMSVTRHLEKLKEELLPATKENFEFVHNKYSELAPFQVFYDIEEYAAKIIPLMKEVDRKIGIEYIDQVWLATFILKKPILPLGLIDEDQDLSPARLLLARLLFENLVFCGDQNQAINAYAGADPESVDKIRKFVDIEMPMKQSFRCPEHICNYVNNIRPANLRPTPGNTEGVQERMELKELGPHLWKLNSPDDPNPELTEYQKKYGMRPGCNDWEQVLILCRYNAPLIRVALELHKNNIPCYIRGNTLIDGLIELIRNRKASSIDELHDKLDTWLEICCRNAPELIQMQLMDKVNCIKLVTPQCNYIEDVPKALKQFLKPAKSKNTVKLSTIHGAKGLEARHVFILFPPIEYPKVTNKSEAEQERNLHFVAASRSSRNLIWVVENE